MRLPDAYLTKREQQIVELLFENERLSASELEGLLPGNPSNSAVRTHLRILVEKGHVTRSKQGAKYVYSVETGRHEAASGALAAIVKTFFKGNVGGAVASLLGDPNAELTEEQAVELRALIDAAREREENR